MKKLATIVIGGIAGIVVIGGLFVGVIAIAAQFSAATVFGTFILLTLFGAGASAAVAIVYGEDKE